MKAKMAALTAVFTTSLAFSGCSSVEVSPPLSSCSPDYRVQSTYGNFSIQQAGRGKAVQWGAYPNRSHSGTRYIVDVYTGGRKYDHKDQSYAPHGSINAGRAGKYSGKLLQISGKVTRSDKEVLIFNMQCRLA